MIIGVLKVGLLLRESHSLKDKRRVLKSIKDRVHSRMNVAIAEVASQDLHQRADLAAVTVSESRVHVEQVLTDVLKLIDRTPRAERFEMELEYF